MATRTFGNYELIAPLATGGMSSVWLARSPGADGIVVLKRLLRAHLGEPEIVAMFQDEADLGELLRHPNLIRTFEHGVAEGEPYIVMERLEGEDVRSVRRTVRRKRGTIPLEVALEIVIRACHGLHAAHQIVGPDGESLGVVHRDVSPHNLIVTFDGDVKVLDFGIAKSTRQRIETKNGVLKGKIPYMAPEQIRAEHIDRRTDVYALGIVLYEMTAGERPYYMSAPSEFALMMAIVHGDIRFPSTVERDYPPELEAIVMRALSSNQERRHPSAAALAQELTAFRDRAGLRGGREMLGAWMAANFDDRILALRAAASPAELAARLADAEKRRREAGDDDDDAVTAPRGKGPVEERATGAQYTLARRPLATAVLATLAGRINESFDGGAVGRAIAESKVVVLDLAGVERVTSYGVREWLTMLGFCKDTELWLARCSEPLVAQLSTIKGFAGHARVASLLLSFRCDQCGATVARLLDLEADAAELSAGAPAPRQCEQCGGEAKPDDDEASLRFARRWLGKPVPAAVRAALSVLAREGDGAPPPIEKIVLGTETHVRLRRGADRRMRFRRVLDGIEGHLRVDVRDPDALDDRSSAELARALLDLGREVASIAVQGAPPALVAALAGSPRVEILSRSADKSAADASGRSDKASAPEKASVDKASAVAKATAIDKASATNKAGALDKASVPDKASAPDEASVPGRGAHEEDPASAGAAAAPRGRGRAPREVAGGTAPLHPKSSSKKGKRAAPVGDVSRQSEDVSRRARDAGSTTAMDLAVPADPPAPGRGASARRRRGSRAQQAAWLVGAVALVGVVAWLRLGGPRGGDPRGAGPIDTADPSRPTPSATAGPIASPDAEKAPPEGIEKIDGSREITSVGRGDTDDVALASARARAVVLLVSAVRAALPADVQSANEGDLPALGADEIARRFVAHLGAGATPERTRARPVAASAERAIAAHFRVSDAAFAEAVAYFGTARSFRGVGVAPALPTVAEAGWVVVAAPAGAALHVRDRIVAVGARRLAPSDLPAAVTAPDPELRVVRGREAVLVRWAQ